MESINPRCSSRLASRTWTTSLDRHQDDDDQARTSMAPWRIKVVFVLMMLMHLMLAIDMTSIAVALPAIAEAMKASERAVFGIGTAYSMAAVVFQQPIAEFSHVMGRKPAVLVVMAVSVAGSVLTGNAPSMAWLLIGRGMQGFGAAGAVLAGVILTDIFTLRQRSTYLPIQNAVTAAGLIAGPTIGTALVQNSSWRRLFYINIAPLTVSALGLSLILVDAEDRNVANGLRHVDWVGILLFIPVVVLVLVPITTSGVYFPWRSLTCIALFVSGAIAMGTLVIHQRFLAQSPMFRRSVFSRRATLCSFFGQAVLYMSLNIMLFYAVVFWTGVRGVQGMRVGVCMLPQLVGLPAGAILGGFLLRTTRRIRLVMLLGWPLLTMSLGLMHYADDVTPLAPLILVNTLVGLACGLVSTAVTLTPLRTTVAADHGHAYAMTGLTRSVGLCLGIATGTAVFSTRLQSQLKKTEGFSLMTAHSLLRMLREARTERDVLKAIIASLRTLWVVCCVACALAGLLCCGPWCDYPLMPGKKAHSSAMIELRDQDSRVAGADLVRHPDEHVVPRVEIVELVEEMPRRASDGTDMSDGKRGAWSRFLGAMNLRRESQGQGDQPR